MERVFIKKKIANIFILAIFLFSGTHILDVSAAPRSWISSQSPKQGDVVAIKILDPKLKPTSASFMGSEVLFSPYESGFIGFLPIGPTVKPGAYKFTATLGDGVSMLRTIWVSKRNVPLIDLGIPAEVGVTPTELVTKLAAEKARLEASFAVTSTPAAFSKSFQSPFTKRERLSSVFGEIRKTGDNQIRHLGIDYGAPKGTAVLALNNGIVSDAYTDTVYGNSIIIDHGQGIFSLYLHLDTFSVKKGEVITRGEQIGTVGKTGYATGPHLHLSVKIRGVSIDPLSLISLPL